MSTDTLEVASAALQLHLETNPDGEVEATIPVSWTLPEGLIREVQEEFKNPHIMLAVTYAETPEVGNTKSLVRYRPTKVYLIDLLRKPQKEYVQFSSVGENFLIAAVVDLADGWAVEEALGLQEKLPAMSIQAKHVDDESSASHEWRNAHLFYAGLTLQSVTVQAEFFAKKPPQWLRSLVGKFFRGKEFDECHFRKRSIAAIALTIPVQLYGIVVRLATLLFGLFMAKRDMTWQNFVAYNPHDFARFWGSSWWLEDKNGEERSWARTIFSPPGIVISVALLAIAMLLISVLPAFYLAIASSVAEHNGDVFDPWAWQNIGFAILVTDVPAAVAITLAVLSEKGILENWRYSVNERIRKQNNEKRVREVPTGTFDELRARQLLATQPAAIKDTTFHLRFHAVKRAVCKPFARN